MAKTEIRLERAKQFIAFSPLKGYENLILEHQMIKEERSMIFEEAKEEIFKTIKSIKKWDELDIKFYDGRNYRRVVAKVSLVDFTSYFIQLDKYRIHFDDIYEIYIKNKNKKF